LLPVLGKILEKIILKLITIIAQSKNSIPNFQFGFRAHHATTHQLHRVADTISATLETKKYCAGVFLDVAKAFDTVWHDGLLFKLKNIFPAPLYLILKFYLANRSFYVRHNLQHSKQYPIFASVPQGSDIAPFLYTIYTSDLPTSENTLVGIYADDTALLSVSSDHTTASHQLQTHLNSLSTEVKYLGLIFDRRLTWSSHLKDKRKKLNSRLHLLRPLLRSKLTLHIKIILYKTLLQPIWTYGIVIWGSVKNSNKRIIQAFQNITLRLITGHPGSFPTRP
jgi:hypothetical protein